MAQNGGSNGLRLPNFVGLPIGLKKVRVQAGVKSTIPARDGTPAITRTMDQTVCQLVQFSLTPGAPSLDIKGTTLTSFFSVVDAKIAAAGEEFVIGTLVRRPVANAVEEGQFTYDLEPLADEQFEIAQRLLWKAGLEEQG